MSWLGIDIGGANLKAADGTGWARSIPFPLWRDPNGLANALRELIEFAPAANQLAITMTGELCDCFSSKVEGVRHILAAAEQAAQQCVLRVYLVDGRLVAVGDARDSPLLAAASNWHALARFACRYVSRRTGLLVDVGSTTTDIIPLIDGQVAAAGHTDTERLLHQELLYRGVGRTPICAIVDSLPWRGEPCPIAAEVFATTADAFLLLNDVQEDDYAAWTADGRPLTPEFSRRRLARQICADAADCSPGDFERIACEVRDALIIEIDTCIESVAQRMPAPPSTIILSGSGEFLLRRLLEQRPRQVGQAVTLSTEIGSSASRCAPAHALAVVAREAASAGLA